MENQPSAQASSPRWLHAGLWIVLAVGFLIAAFKSQNGPAFLAAAVTAAYLAVGAWAGNILYFVVFSPVVFFVAMFIAMFVIISSGR